MNFWAVYIKSRVQFNVWTKFESQVLCFVWFSNGSLAWICLTNLFLCIDIFPAGLLRGDLDDNSITFSLDFFALGNYQDNFIEFRELVSQWSVTCCMLLEKGYKIGVVCFSVELNWKRGTTSFDKWDEIHYNKWKKFQLHNM